jgi:uncharacterized protein YpiB (UPF0302 family)
MYVFRTYLLIVLPEISLHLFILLHALIRRHINTFTTTTYVSYVRLTSNLVFSHKHIKVAANTVHSQIFLFYKNNKTNLLATSSIRKFANRAEET